MSRQSPFHKNSGLIRSPRIIVFLPSPFPILSLSLFSTSIPFLPITTVSGIYISCRRRDRGERLSRLSNVQPVIGLPVKVTGTREDAISAGDRDLPALFCLSVGQGGRFFTAAFITARLWKRRVCFRPVRFKAVNIYYPRMPPITIFYKNYFNHCCDNCRYGNS